MQALTSWVVPLVAASSSVRSGDTKGRLIAILLPVVGDIYDVDVDSAIHHWARDSISLSCETWEVIHLFCSLFVVCLS